MKEKTAKAGGEKILLSRKIVRKSPNIWKRNNTLLSSPRVKEEIKKGIRKCLELNENRNNMFKFVRCS